MQSQAADVPTYLGEIPPDRRAALTRLRELCLRILVGYEESMEYGMPSYKQKGVMQVAFASQKNHIALYILKQDVVNLYRDALKGASIGKGCIKYAKPEKLDWQVIEQLLKDTFVSSELPC